MGNFLASAKHTLKLETEGLKALSDALENELADDFCKAAEIIKSASGRVIITGMGKSGHVAQKVAATMASTGTPAYFVHPSEASHGDLGMITKKDVVLSFSWSGETVELMSLIEYSRRFAVPLISVTSNKESTLAKSSEVALVLPNAQEACPLGLAPTTSTTMQIALGDALAVALLESHGFTATDFKVFHPGGTLGANLKYVGDIMHKEDELPLINLDTVMSEALVTMTEKSFGCLGVVDSSGQLAGIITDGDLRRKMGPNLLESKAESVMTQSPKTVTPDTLASAALEQINSSNITSFFVVDGNKPVGIVHVHDLLRIGVA